MATLATIQVTVALHESPTYDESIHLGAGLAYIKAGDYRFNQEHPPLIKILCALPLLGFGAKIFPDSPAWKSGNELNLGYDVLYHNVAQGSADAFLFSGRLVVIALTLLFAAWLAWWVRSRFGSKAALFALAFYCLEPNIIAHGHYITTDLPLAMLFFACCVTWSDHLASGRTSPLVWCAVFFGLAQVTKFSALLLIPTLLVLYAIRWNQTPVRRAVKASAVLLTAFLLAVALFYAPDTIRYLTSGAPTHAYIAGLNDVIGHNSAGHPTYLLGMHSQKGWWYYFPVAFAVKTTVATLLLLFLAVFFPRVKFNAPIPGWTLTLPPLLFFAFSMTSNLNLGVRHILPVYPFLFVAAAVVITRVPKLAIALVTLLAVECAGVYPFYTAFFNAPSGGPRNGPHYLLDSNIDWGQDGKRLAEYLKSHGTNEAWIDYFGTADLHYYDLNWKPLPSEPQNLNGYAAASVTELYGVYQPPSRLRWLREKTPIAKIGYSIYVYDLRNK